MAKTSGRPLYRTRMCKDSKGDGPENIDWDSDWKDYQGRTVERDTADNVFKLGGGAESRGNSAIDERVERVTGAWTSETGYLIGIVVIVLIAVGESYVWWQSQAR